MKKCILIDRSKVDNRDNILDCEYNKDIKEVEIDIKDLLDGEVIDSAPFREPVPYYYNIVPRDKYKKLHSIIGADFLHWSFVNYYSVPMIMITTCCGAWKYEIMAKMSMIYPSGNPKAIFINKKHYVWGNALFYSLDKDLSRDFFMVNIYEKAFISTKKFKFKITEKPKNKEERYGVAVGFIEQLVDEYYLTLEDAYILFGTQLNHEYVSGGYNFYQSGNSFHAHYEFCKHFIQLTLGTELHKEKEPVYMWSIVSDPPLKCKNYDTYNDMMKKHMKLNNLKYIDPTGGIKEEDVKKEKNIGKKNIGKKNIGKKNIGKKNIGKKNIGKKKVTKNIKKHNNKYTKNRGKKKGRRERKKKKKVKKKGK
jgi:hypothetical protein